LLLLLLLLLLVVVLLLLLFLLLLFLLLLFVTPTRAHRGGVPLGSSRAHVANGQPDLRIALALDNHMDAV
jgi:hypothetical protein